MRSTRGNKLPVLLFMMVSLLIGACQHISEKQLLTGRWQYIKVLNNDTAMFPIEDTDYIEFKSDSTFHYEIASVRKDNSGTWQYIDHCIRLKYNDPDTVRTFSVEIISKRDLIFEEGTKQFVLKRLE